VVSKKSLYGAPVQLNYPAMLYSLVVRITERIPTMKDLIKRLKNGYIFRLDCGFLLSDWVPSEASYSRMLTKISQTDVLERVQETLLIQAIIEGYLDDHTVAIDATHIEVQLDVSLEELHTSVSIDPKWGVKKNSEGKNTFWFGFKGHLAVGTQSQYILQSFFSSGNMNDGKAAIPLLKGVHTHLPQLQLAYATMDAGYDYPAIYKERTAVEHVIGYFKEFFQLNNVRYRTGKRAKVHFDLVTLVYNAAKLACDRINCKLQTARRAA
jgi:transposase